MTLLLLALIPALALLFYYYNKDRHPEPWGWVAFVFLLGAASIFVALPLEEWAKSFFPQGNDRTIRSVFWECLLVPGLIEETTKLLVVVVAVFWRRDFDEPVDGLVYGTAAALGFTFAEDWRAYVLYGEDWTRMLSAVAHPWFAVFWASALGWAKFHPPRLGIPLLIAGLFGSVFIHGFFDFLVIASQILDSAWPRHLLAPILVTLYWVLDHRLDAANARPSLITGQTLQ